MKIKIFVFLALAGLLSLQLLAQKKCKFQFEEEDPFTGKISKGTSTPIYALVPASNEYWYVGLNRAGDDYSVSVDLQLDGELKTLLNAGDSIMFRTEDGSRVTCYASEKASALPTTGKVWDHSVASCLYKAKYIISPEQISVLARSPLTHIRMNVSDEVYQAEVKEKHGKDFLNCANCILQ